MTADSKRTSAPLSSKLDAKLIAYMAAGLGTITAVQTADAKIVYTPANAQLNATFGNVPLDLNNDGIVDLNFLYTGITYGTALFAYPVGANRVIRGHSGAAALPWGMRIGPKASFQRGSYRMAIAGRDGCHPYCSSFGDWVNKKSWFLGIQFSIAGQTHYGWARLSVGKPIGGSFSPTLTGYAYETVANKPIIAGQTSGFAAATYAPSLPTPNPQPANLGLLARGTDGRAIWRREETN